MCVSRVGFSAPGQEATGPHCDQSLEAARSNSAGLLVALLLTGLFFGTCCVAVWLLPKLTSNRGGVDLNSLLGLLVVISEAINSDFSSCIFF